MSAIALPKEPIATDVPLAVGSTLAGVYRIDRVLGTGGMGWVLGASHGDRKVAIKVLPSSAASDPEQVARFRRETKAVAKLGSDHVVRVVDSGDLENGLPYLVMEHLDGESLAALLKENAKTKTAVDVGLAVDWILQAIHGLAEAHAKGIIHRDLKPANLFLAKRGSGTIIKVLDFGASKLTESSSVDPSDPGGVTIASSLIGSPRYMAPEQIRSALEVDERVDIYGLGATMYELLSGKPIFQADTLARIFARVLWDEVEPLASMRDDVPPELDAAVLRCLAKEREDRFDSVRELARALAPFATNASEGLLAEIETPPAAPTFRPPAKRRPETERPAAPSPPASGTVRIAPFVLEAAVRAPKTSASPKRTMKLAAFALASRLVPGRVDVTPTRSATVRLRRVEIPRATPSPAVPLAAILASAAAVVGVAATLAYVVAREPSPSPSPGKNVEPNTVTVTAATMTPTPRAKKP